MSSTDPCSYTLTDDPHATMNTLPQQTMDPTELPNPTIQPQPHYENTNNQALNFRTEIPYYMANHQLNYNHLNYDYSTHSPIHNQPTRGTSDKPYTRIYGPPRQNPRPICTRCPTITQHLPASLIKKLIEAKILNSSNPFSCSYLIHQLSENLPHYLFIAYTQPFAMKTKRFITYYQLNLSNITQHKINITSECFIKNPTLKELFDFCSGIQTPSAKTYWPGRLYNSDPYYPSCHVQTLNTYITNLDKETPFSNYAPFHSMVLSPYMVDGPSTNIEPDWKSTKLINIYEFFSTLAFLDKHSEPWITFSSIRKLFSDYELETDILPTSFILSKSTKLLQGASAEIIDEYLKQDYSNHEPSNNPPDIHTMIPATTAARAIEIFMSLLAYKRGIPTYTPITGTVSVLTEITPFILINGSPYISWLWTNQIVPWKHNLMYHHHNKNFLQLGKPIHIHGWLRIHWDTANRISGLPPQTNSLIPLRSALIALNTNASWIPSNRQLNVPQILNLTPYPYK